MVKKPGHQVCVGLFWMVLYHTLSLIISNIHIVQTFPLYYIEDFLTILLMDEIDILLLEVTEEAIQEFFSERLAK